LDHALLDHAPADWFGAISDLSPSFSVFSQNPPVEFVKLFGT
jgi:hypothetical protein